MADITPTTPSFTFGYWRPWKENSNYFDSYLNYAKDVSLAKYQADTVGQYISQASSEQVQAIGELGEKIGLASYEQVQAIGQLGDRIELASYEQVQAIGKLGEKIRMGLKVLSNQMSEINQRLYFIDRNLDVLIEQQKLTNLLLQNIGELLRVPDSEKERQHSIELGLKFFVNAQKDDDLFADALEELLEAENLMKQDYFVLHRIGLIYMYSVKHINPQLALDYFARAAKYASVESDPKAARLANVLAVYGNRANTSIATEIAAIESLAADSYEKAAFAAYVLGNFELAVTYQNKAVKFNYSAENLFFLAKYQTRTKQIDLCIQNLENSIDEKPEMALAVFKDLDLVNEPGILKLISKKNDDINRKIIKIKEEWGTAQSDLATTINLNHEKILNATYDDKVGMANYYDIEISGRNWEVENLDVRYFRNGDKIYEAKTNLEWENAGMEGKPAWCYYDNDPANGKKYGKLYNWFAVNDPRGLAPPGWVIRSYDDWDDMFEVLGGIKVASKKMRSINGWGFNNGTDEIGFKGLPGGIRNPFISKFQSLCSVGSWWSSTEMGTDKVYSLILYGTHDEIDEGFYDKSFGMSVRCVSKKAHEEVKNKSINNEISNLILEFETVQSDRAKEFINMLKEALDAGYSKKVEVLNLACSSDSRNFLFSNLNVSFFRNGDKIPEANTIEEWLNAIEKEEPIWCYYDFSPEYGKKFGKLYNWFAVNDPRNLAPKGWHIPDIDELNIIKSNINYLKNQLKAGKFSFEHKMFFDFYSIWWCKSQGNNGNNEVPIISNYGSFVSDSKANKFDGLPVRCLKD